MTWVPTLPVGVPRLVALLVFADAGCSSLVQVDRVAGSSSDLSGSCGARALQRATNRYRSLYLTNVGLAMLNSMNSTATHKPATAATHEAAIQGFTRRLAVLLTLKHWLLLVTAWCFVWGLTALVLRAVAGTPRRPLWWGALGVVMSIIVALLWARRQLPTRAAVSAVLDSQNNCDGLLMTSEETALGDWQARLPQINLPRLRWRGARAWSLCLAALVFVIASLLAPVRWAGLDAGQALDVSREAAQLAEQIEELKEAQLVAETKTETLAEQLAQLRQEASGADPAQTWEALDHLADAVRKAAQEAASAAAAQQQQLTRAAALAEGLLASGAQLDAKTMTEAMQTLTTMMQQALQEDELLARNLAPQTQAALKSGAMKSEHLKEVAQALGQSEAALNQKLANLKQAGLNRNGTINPAALKGGAQVSRRDNAGLAQFLKENAPKMSVADAVEAWCEGKGDVGRGRGPAAMTWTDGSSEKDTRFKEKVLPPAAVAGLKDSQLVGLSARAPQTNAPNAPAHGALNNAASGGGAAYTQPILPRHKGAVKRYFERK